MRKKYLETTSASLHVMAMFFMLLDHMWGTIIPGNDWLTCIGRLAFPIFAFLLVEGYFHTSNLKHYVSRLLIFALISEIPFNLVMSGSLFYPLAQNVLWSFLISIFLIWCNEKVAMKEKKIPCLLVAIGTIFFGFIIGIATMVDYHGAGVLTVLAFYFFRGNSFKCRLFQFLVLFFVNTEILGGLGVDFNLFGETFFFAYQSIALLSLIPIWLYKGRLGHHSKFFKYICYAFYPAHLLLLWVVMSL